MNLIQIARETIAISKEEKYRVGEKEILFPAGDWEKAVVISPEDGKELLEWKPEEVFQESMCQFEVRNADSFQAARDLENPFVMNFANAHIPGGGFLLGATAQEEALCRCSTLYRSIHSERAAEMYRYNNKHLGPVESDYMLLSPEVLVFRNERCEFLETPFRAGVVTIPAPNRYGAAFFASGELIRETMMRRIRIMLRLAAKNGYRSLVLGAWGCGAFGNDPRDVAGYFYQILVEEEYGRCFDYVCFAVFGKENGQNITAFREVFA